MLIPSLHSSNIIIYLIAVAHAAHITGRSLGTRWIEEPYYSDKVLTEDDKKVFDTTISNSLSLGAQLTGGSNNRGLYVVQNKYQEHEENSLVVKVLKTIDNNAFAEVKALKDVGDLVGAGMLALPDGPESGKILNNVEEAASKSESESTSGNAKTKRVPVIIMKKKRGDVLFTISAYKNTDRKQKRELREETLNLMCEVVANYAMNKGVLHNDNHPMNVLVTLSPSGDSVRILQLVDWGGTGTYKVNRELVKRNEVIDFCKMESAPLWTEISFKRMGG
ncbi:hypothetical protein GYMLUDRAFT_68645 [Collybiopsis luxurians FD-317 M1]|nr:hypothetical protein GYMLUDRAFT_68645 [Collybiopsis luxurians FD-317 M1]